MNIRSGRIPDGDRPLIDARLVTVLSGALVLGLLTGMFSAGGLVQRVKQTEIDITELKTKVDPISTALAELRTIMIASVEQLRENEQRLKDHEADCRDLRRDPADLSPRSVNPSRK